MTDTDTKPVEAGANCFDLKGGGVEAVFATQFTSDNCMDAITRAQAQFYPGFPGWALYRRVVTGDALLDRQLEAYAISMARGVTRSLKANGRFVVGQGTRRPGWVAQAGRDGLDYALFGKFACGVGVRCEQFGVSNKPYQLVRDSVAGGLWIGIATFESCLHHEYFKILSRQKYSAEYGMG